MCDRGQFAESSVFRRIHVYMYSRLVGDSYQDARVYCTLPRACSHLVSGEADARLFTWLGCWSRNMFFFRATRSWSEPRPKFPAVIDVIIRDKGGIICRIGHTRLKPGRIRLGMGLSDNDVDTGCHPRRLRPAMICRLDWRLRYELNHRYAV